VVVVVSLLLLLLLQAGCVPFRIPDW